MGVLTVPLLAHGSLFSKGTPLSTRLFLECFFLGVVSSPSQEGSVPTVTVEKSRIKDKVPAKDGWPRDVLGPPGLGGPSGVQASPPESREQPGGLMAIYAIYILIYTLSASPQCTASP